MNTVILISQLFILVAANNEITEAAAGNFDHQSGFTNQFFNSESKGF